MTLLDTSTTHRSVPSSARTEGCPRPTGAPDRFILGLEILSTALRTVDPSSDTPEDEVGTSRLYHSPFRPSTSTHRESGLRTGGRDLVCRCQPTVKESGTTSTVDQHESFDLPHWTPVLVLVDLCHDGTQVLSFPSRRRIEKPKEHSCFRMFILVVLDSWSIGISGRTRDLGPRGL